MKIKGAELQQFMNTGWPQPDGDWFWDHEEFDETHCSSDPDPAETYDTNALGSIMYQGSGVDPTNGDGYDLARLIRRWRKEQNCVTITISVPKEKLADCKFALKRLGIKY
jgi:hypothetical protein